MKKLLYLSDLYNFYVTQNKNVKFSSKDNDTTIVVHIDEPFTYEKNEDDDLNLYAPIRLCHTEKNINQSYISEKAMKNAIDTAYEMPILGYIYPDPDNEEQLTFAGHEFYMNDDNELVYEEVPIGVVSSKEKLKLVYDADADKTYLDGLGKIWRTYTKAAEILEREKKFSVSVELCVDELSYDSKEKVLCIDAFRFSGVAILGKSRYDGSEIKPGMTGANISIEDFSEKNNSVFSANDKVIELLSALNEKIDNLNIDQKLRKEEPMKKDFEEKPEEEIKDSPSAEVFDGDPEPSEDEQNYYDDEPQGDDEVSDSDADAPTLLGGSNDGGDEGDDEDPEPTEDGIPLGQRDDDDTAGESKKKYSVEYTIDAYGEKKTFSVSLKDKLFALTKLVNDTYSESDGAWYDVDVYEDDKTIVAHDYWNDKHFRQTYSVKKDVYSLKGDRVNVYAQYLTEDEIAKLDDMKSNYSSTQDKLAQYEAEPEKLEVINSADYAQIKDIDAFKKLAERDTYFSMTVDEVRAEADKQLLEFAKSHKIEFSSEEPEKKQVGMKLFGNPTKKTTKGSSRYGGLFSK